MNKPKAGIAEAYWLGPRSGCILLHKNWRRKTPPTLKVSSSDLCVTNVRVAESDFVGRFFGVYEQCDGRIVFCQEAERHPQIDFQNSPVRVAGDFNNWGRDELVEDWQLRPRETDDGRVLWECAVDRRRLGADLGHVAFKFVSADWHWLKVKLSAPNLIFDGAGNMNHVFEGHRTGHHVLLFDVEGGRGIDGEHAISIVRPWRGQEVPIHPGLSFFDLVSDLPLGAHFEDTGGGQTVFRVFAPRAQAAWVEFSEQADAAAYASRPMNLLEDQVTWELRLPGNLHGWFYFLRISGDHDVVSSHFDEGMRLLDPWALASVGATGPGIVIDRRTLPRPRASGGFTPPHWHDLVIVEAHLRDVLAQAPIDLSDGERMGFRGLTRYVGSDDSYFRTLGANTLELLPVAQFDAPNREDYHWGYMTNNFFAPSASYASAPEHASQINELHDLVAECHRQGLAVILDVVYNHVGEPSFLLFLDKQYYFHVEADGTLTNWSGCGNTLRAESAMAKRLIIESLVHLIETYDVDGFRFDLAELISVEVLSEIERALKAVKDSIILIAEPWSFRGNIAWRLRSTGFAFWNDGYREFLRKYLCGESDAASLLYHMKGCLDHLTKFPAQSVNYVASHDDRCWIDKITENPEHDGRDPTADDIYRTHLMAVTLMCSLGIPMLAAGMDFLQSKNGVHNTYQRPDLNALDYERAGRFGLTADYFQQCIAFRLSPWGELLRLWNLPTPDYLRLFEIEDSSAAAVLFNADLSNGDRQIFFAINPHDSEVEFSLDQLPADGWEELADRDDFDLAGLVNGRLEADESRLVLGPLDCGLWVRIETSDTDGN